MRAAWPPTWPEFPLKVFRGPKCKILRIQPDWDDATLLNELRVKYDELRTVWRKWFSLKSVASITMVLSDDSLIYPQRVGPAKVGPAKHKRLRYLLDHPWRLSRQHEFMLVLTARTDLGIEFIELWQLSRITIAIVVPVLASAAIGVVYSVAARDTAAGFTIAGYVTSAYAVLSCPRRAARLRGILSIHSLTMRWCDAKCHVYVYCADIAVINVAAATACPRTIEPDIICTKAMTMGFFHS
ncbi:hypothetical protein DAEQUDRAFT_413800 [Daedalea quercina L-15889]|uniref:Uncharacterized protein n=1 Tax=Daedalea quercina L-15889 TaxID=1314783 RepID=A0A165THU0_9APHY|nr:hypothetical protein DAEQUDRAFT_413800 [Daedalea quercina L-15889]